MKKLLGIACLVAVSALPAAAEPGNLLGVFGNWTAYSAGSGSSMTCFVMSKPRASRPTTAKRGQNVWLIVSDYPSRKIKGEPQIAYGYQAKEGAPAALGVGGDKFTFFIRNTGKDGGSAWLQKVDQTPALLSAMQGGVSAVTSGTSAKGTKTVDTYALAGFNDALAKAHAVCQM